MFVDKQTKAEINKQRNLRNVKLILYVTEVKIEINIHIIYLHKTTKITKTKTRLW